MVLHMLTVALTVLLAASMSAAIELYGSEAIVCLTSAAGTNPATLQPRRYTHEDGYDVCVRYQSLIDTDWTWVYGATSSSKCAQLMQQPGQYRNVQCCMERNCNMPDPVLDPATEVADLPAPAASLQPAEAGDHLPARLRRLHRYSRSHTPSGRASVGSLTCYRTLHKKGAQADHVSAVAPKTYRKSGSMDVCTRYTYKCADGDMACSTADVKAGLWKWMYAPLSAATCLELKGYSKKADALIKQVKCCTSPLCNAPDGQLDPDTKVLASPAATAKSRHRSSRHRGAAKALDTSRAAAAATGTAKLTSDQPKTVAAAESPVRAAAGRDKSSAAVAALSQGSRVHKARSAGGRSSSRLVCYTREPETVGQQAFVRAKAYHKARDRVDVCSRYQVKCTSNTQSSCRAVAGSNATWIWEYKPLSRPACDRLRISAVAGDKAAYKNVTCCSSSHCNKPDQTLDLLTKIQEPQTAAAVTAAANAADVLVKPDVSQQSGTSGHTAQLPGAAAAAGLPAMK